MANKSTGKLELWLTEIGDKLYDTLATHLPFNFNTIDNNFTELDNKVEDMVIDNLISTETDKALSAKQGKVLKDNIGDLFELETSEKSNLVKAVNEHLAEDATLTALGHVKHGTYESTLNTTWSGSTAPFSKAQTVTGILATDTPIIDIIMSGTYATDEERIEAWGYIYRAVTSANTITFYATEKPTVELPLQIKVVR